MNFDEKKNQDAEKCYLRDETSQMLDVTIDVDTCRQAGKKRLRYTTPKPNR